MSSEDNKGNVARALELIRSDKSQEEIDSQYNELIESNKEIGAPTNNVILRAILDEQKRTNRYIDTTINEFRNLSVGMSSIINSVESLASTMQEMNDTIKDQMELQASMRSSMGISDISTPDTPVTRRTVPNGIEWFYQSSILNNKYKIIGAVLSHLINMIKLRLETSGIFYPDSVDCSFDLFSNCISKACNVRCSIPDVEYRNKINIREKNDPAYKVLLPIVASKNPVSPTSLREDQIKDLWDPRLRNVMQETEWIRQRLCRIEGVLSPQQCDILKSISFPIVKDGELNWDPNKINVRKSHPISQDIEALGQTQKLVYVESMARGKDMVTSYEEAYNFQGKTKTK